MANSNLSNEKPEEPQRLSVHTLARKKNLPDAMLLRAIDRGDLRAYRPGKRTLYVELADWERWWAAQVYTPRRSSR
jgi:hypothetical protein